MNKERLSSIELLRIIAIFFILIAHTYMVTCNLPSSEDISCNVYLSFLKVLLYSFAIGGVDIFVLISGWFGIHASKRGITKYIYQVCFLLWLIPLVFWFFDDTKVYWTTVKASFWSYHGYWFIVAYLGMYLMSPILNAFIEKATKRQFQSVLLFLYLFQCYFSWLSNSIDYYGGYSIMFFCILYLTSRYVRLYSFPLITCNSESMYLGGVLIIAIVTTLSLRVTGTALRMLRYDNPLVIFTSLCILSSFYKLHFNSKIINRLAASCLAVYIIHFNPLVFPYFTRGITYIFDTTFGIKTLFLIFLFLCFVFLCCVIVDGFRIYSWNLILKLKRKYKT